MMHILWSPLNSKYYFQGNQNICELTFRCVHYNADYVDSNRKIYCIYKKLDECFLIPLSLENVKEIRGLRVCKKIIITDYLKKNDNQHVKIIFFIMIC